MQILTECDIETVFGTDNSISTYEKYLSFYKLLENHANIFLEKLESVSLSDVLYSKYYWFLKLKKENEQTHGVDAGFDEQAYDLLVRIYEYSGIIFDAEVYAEAIKTIENLVYSQ